MPSRVSQLETSYHGELPICLHLSIATWVFPCQFFPYTIPKNPKPLDSGTSMNFRVRKLLFPYERSKQLPSTLPPHLPSCYHQTSLCSKNNASLVPGKPTWCTEMLCNTKWLFPSTTQQWKCLSDKLHVMLASTCSGWLQSPPLCLLKWGQQPPLQSMFGTCSCLFWAWNRNHVFMIFVNLDFLHLVL
jgi:hypothetical protein